MKKRFRHGCKECMLIAQSDTADLYLHWDPAGASIVARTDNSKLQWMTSISVNPPAADDVLFGPAVVALQKAGLMPAG